MVDGGGVSSAVDVLKTVIRSADTDMRLPLRFFDVQEAMAQPTERQTEPFPCQPAFFVPSKDLPSLTQDGQLRTSFGKVIVDVSRTTLHEYFGKSIAPYTIIEYSIRDPYGDCKTGALEILNDGKHVALYTHVYQNEWGNNEWNINPVSKKLVMHSRRVQDSRWVEQSRLIDLPTKETRALPLDPCYINARVLDDGTMLGGFGDVSRDNAAVYCPMGANGVLLAKMSPEGVGGASLSLYYFDAERKLIAFADLGSQLTRFFPADSHAFVVVNMDDPSEWVVLPFPWQQTCGEEEFDFSDFSFTEPHLRYRYPLYNVPCVEKTGRMSEWVMVP